MSQNWHLYQLDILNAFLHGDLEDEVYIRQYPEFVNSDFSTYVCKLKKSIYGLKQTPRAWFAKLSNQLFSFSFTCFVSDFSLLYIKLHLLICSFLCSIVDDIIMTSSNFKTYTKVYLLCKCLFFCQRPWPFMLFLRHWTYPYHLKTFSISI